MAYSNFDDFDCSAIPYENKQKSIFKEIITDRVDHPSHYTRGRVEVIDVIEDAVEDAPTKTTAVLQAQVIKYILRMWNKDNPREDARKAKWYLERLIDKLSVNTNS